MKSFILITFTILAGGLHAQKGEWTKNDYPITSQTSYNTAIAAQNSNIAIKSDVRKMKTELELQREISTHQNMEIEELLSENELQRQQINLMLKELAALKEELQALKKELN